MKLFVSYAGDIICLLPVLNILSLTVLPGKFIKNTEQVPKKTTSEFPCPGNDAVPIKAISLTLTQIQNLSFVVKARYQCQRAE